mgnify:CR=1 FL=1
MPRPRVAEPAIGSVFGAWTVVGGFAPYDWVSVVCRCGVQRKVRLYRLAGRGRISRSCGCVRVCQPRKHGDSFRGRTKEYIAWHNIVQRCLNPHNKRFPLYGGRGIAICDEWRYDFAAFLGYVGRAPSPRHTIDRINNNGNYEPGNVRWATYLEQNRNTSRSRRIVINGEDVPLKVVADRHNLPYPTVLRRYKQGWGPEQITLPLGSRLAQ